MPFDPTTWENEPDLLGVLKGTVPPTSTTPIDADGMNDLEDRVDGGLAEAVAAANGKVNGAVLSASGAFNIAYAETQVNGAFTLPAATITVDSTTGFDDSGDILIGAQRVSYTGKTSTTFTGCTGGSGSVADNAAVKTARPLGYNNGTVRTVGGLDPQGILAAGDSWLQLP